MRRRVIRVQRRKDGWWKVVEAGKELYASPTKAVAVVIGRDLARQSWAYHGVPSQLVVHTRKGTISFECTYPRSSDPKRRKG